MSRIEQRVDARGYVIPCIRSGISEEVHPDASIAYSGVGFCTLPSDIDGQCEKPQNVGRQQIQIPTLLHFINYLTADEGKTEAPRTIYETPLFPRAPSASPASPYPASSATAAPPLATLLPPADLPLLHRHCPNRYF